MRQGQHVCPDCLRDLTRALHEPGCPTATAERREACWRRAISGATGVIVACSCGLHVGEVAGP